MIGAPAPFPPVGTENISKSRLVSVNCATGEGVGGTCIEALTFGGSVDELAPASGTGTAVSGMVPALGLASLALSAGDSSVGGATVGLNAVGTSIITLQEIKA
jgi:hypothetical protein